MSHRFLFPPLLAAAALTATVVASNDARACGGCFHEPDPVSQKVTSVVTGHRMAFALSTTRTVLWDQVKYTGSPAGFAWVLPVKAGAFIEASTDAWFEALDAATSAQIVPPQTTCAPPAGSTSQGCGCESTAGVSEGGSLDAFGGPSQGASVTVVHEGSVGPYETVTIHANVKNALPAWLLKNGYAIDPSVSPIIDAYTSEGFDFIALRLKPGAGVQQMKPVRVVSPGASPVLPLRMVAAGTGASVDITLFVIGEGRWEAQNFPNVVASPALLSWDFNASDSNFAAERELLFAPNGGRTWINAFAKPGALLSQLTNPIDQETITYQVSQQSTGISPATIADLYVQQGIANGEVGGFGLCQNMFGQYATSTALVVASCAQNPSGTGSATGTGGAASGTGGATGVGGAANGTGGTATGTGGPSGAGGACPFLSFGEIAAGSLVCDKLDDVAAALIGMHPASVWITRLEAQLPRGALEDDLELQASSSQKAIENWLQATHGTNLPKNCTIAGAPPPAGCAISVRSRRMRDETAAAAALLAALGVLILRRTRRG